MRVRPAVVGDAAAMSAVLRAIIAESGRDRPSDLAFVLATYIVHPDRVACTVALDEEDVVAGFQSLRRARAGNPYGTPVGWGIIGTHVAPLATRKGVGSTLFAVTREAAREGGLARIDATIDESNARGLRYYEALGFRTYRTGGSTISKFYEVA